MNLEHLDYSLPPELIAQEPPAERTAARLLQLDRHTGALRHGTIADLPRLLRAGDLLVLNDTKVIPARLRGRRPSGGRLEVLLIRAVGDDEWEAIVRGSPRVGETVHLPEGVGRFTAHVGDGRWRICLDVGGPIGPWLDRVGEIPLPPYIRRADGPSPDDCARYQTVYAREPGAVAAPTAGLHFTPALFDALHAVGIQTAAITLHVGPGTFLPVRSGALDAHTMEAEPFELGAAAVEGIRSARADGRRVLAVGTTTVRALESAAAQGALAPGQGAADLFIRPGHRFAVIDGLLTNFHLPRTPLLALVAALASWERVRAAYDEAVAQRYRFYSFGDAMLIT